MTDTAALAIRDDQAMWDDRQRAVLIQTGIPEDISNAELAAFLHVCQRTKLDPFARQIYLIPRWNAEAQREVFTPQTGIDGLRVIARRVADATGRWLSYYGPLWCGNDGQWRDVWLEEGPPAAAKMIISRSPAAAEQFTGVATYREYCARKKDGTPFAMWAKMPANQLAKCAEAQALRKAFPNDLAGLYAAEEMERTDLDTAERQPLPPKMTRHIRDDTDRTSREWVPGTVEYERAGNREALYKAQNDVQSELNRLGIWNREERLHEVAYVLGRLDDPPGSFADLSIDEASRAAGELRKRATPDVDAGI